ncbi:TetR/AcrR family transcriptional regulator [Microbacterium kyungheense]|uniref:TetR family transcriptional regulator n=1 Tax=Microbacterium kyungheense TaxID=1263636 RepID=A0A543FL83_9MICO|nr:TetR/AcrR family transcriptional regulator [Microbacterium kyungheense]TQM34572.1 TetR family transcriptional regulator [Microbacterium kyungheense]
MGTPRRQRERSETTAARLVAVAAQLFGDEGYTAVSTDDIAARAGLTKGALYHHFADKSALFRAVFVQLQQELVSTLTAAAADAGGGWDGFVAGVDAFIRECERPSIGRIIVIDGPAVLGRDEARTVEDGYVGALLTGALSRLQEAGQLRRGDSAVRSRLLLGALCEAAIVVAAAADSERARKAVLSEVVAMLDGLRARQDPAPAA